MKKRLDTNGANDANGTENVRPEFLMLSIRVPLFVFLREELK